MFGPLKWYTGGGGGGRRNKLVPQTIFSGLVGHNPNKSGKFLSAPLIFSFPYAHGSACMCLKLVGNGQMFLFFC
jgi:hypothetical protein